jgi:dihydroflavonol-4-reductase
LRGEGLRPILVTGGAGFAGAHLVRALQSRGERVRVLDLKPAAGDENIEGSICDREIALKASRGVDAVFHLAGNAELWARDSAVFDAVNRRGTEVMIEAAVQSGVRRFIHCSSLTTLVGRRSPIGASDADETRRLEPQEMLGPYPRSKLMAERAVEAAARKGLDAVIAIPTEPLGPQDRALTPPTRMIRDLLNGALPATIACTLNFVPVESLALGLIAARDRGRRGERYLLGGENIGMSDLLAAIERVSGAPMPKLKLPYAVALAAGVVDTLIAALSTGRRPQAPLTGVRLAGRRVSFSSDKAARELDWKAGPFEPALKAAVDWLRAEGLAR